MSSRPVHTLVVRYYLKKIKTKRSQGMDQVVEHLPDIFEALSSISSITKRGNIKLLHIIANEIISMPPKY
jgi:hypothetical protein